jgi:tetratricopeptide (TPR) repeat protein
MTKKRLAAAMIAVILSASAAAQHGGGESESASPAGPPPPRVVEPLGPRPLPPRSTDPSWLLYQEGVRLFGEKRLGESLVCFKKAIDSRAKLFEGASSGIAAALDTKEAAKAKGSIASLVDLLAERDLIPHDLEAIRERAEGSLISELGLLRELSPSPPLRGLIDAALLVMEERGLSRIGDSLKGLARAADELARYPEAEFWIGKVYLAEGEYRLAELQFLRAYGMAESLEVGDDRFEMLEALAGIYKARGDLKDYEKSLLAVAEASDLFASKDEFYRNAMERTLARQGIDKFMSMYRVDPGFAERAYSALGKLYLEAGRPLAVLYLAAAVNSTLTKAIAAIKADSPMYSFTGVADLASRILADKALARYAAGAGLWDDMNGLGEALSATGYRESAREIWSCVARALGPKDPAARRAAALSEARPR